MPTWLKAAVLMLVMLFAGAFLGIAYERRVTTRSETPDGSHHLMHRMTDELNLDSAQTAAVDAIVRRHQPAVDSTWHAMQPRVRATLDSVHEEILRVLRPDQATAYRAMMRDAHSRTGSRQH